jgi:hypothetical protein
MSLLKYENNNSTYLNKVYQSTFKNDYFNPNTTKRQSQIEPPSPAEILHKDHNLNMSSSISMARTGYPIRNQSEKTNKKDLIFQSNFKLGDEQKIPIADPITSTFFQPPNKYEPIPDTTEIANTFMQSHVPNGDPEKNIIGNESVYKEQFRGHKTIKIPDRAYSKHYFSESAKYKADPKFLQQHWYKTSQQESHDPKIKQGIKKGPAHSKLESNKLRSNSSVPTGDKDHLRMKHTTTQLQDSFKSFNSKDIMSATNYRKNLVDSRYTTSIKLSDVHKIDNTNKIGNNYDYHQSENKNKYTAIPVNMMYPLERTDIERNYSDIPQGDEMQHMDSTTASHFFKDYSNIINSQKNIIKHQRSRTRNKSYVNLGLTGAHDTYLSTTDSSYLSQPPEASPEMRYLKTNSHEYRGSQGSVDHIIPLPYKDLYKPIHQNNTYTITQKDFPHHDEYKKLKLNKVPLKHLKSSHWKQPLKKETNFTTTNSDLYKPIDKSRDSRSDIVVKKPEVGWLQKSNVPLGTMGKYIDGCHRGWY